MPDAPKARPFRFGVQLTGADSREAWIEKAKRAESLGYSVATIVDHMGDQLAPIPALTAIAMSTATIRVGTMVLANDWRNPLLVAREAATLDWLSNGRLELGIGAGWLMTDYEQLGIVYDPPTARVERMRLSLEGLGLGDALGEMLSYRAESASRRLAEKNLPPAPWFHTDDTEMAISIVEVLRLLGAVNQDALARQFAWRYEREPDRGYGSGARRQLRMIVEGAEWRVTSREAFGGQGSLGNGSAMRVAPVGAWFADDLDRAAAEARASAMVTHMHYRALFQITPGCRR